MGSRKRRKLTHRSGAASNPQSAPASIGERIVGSDRNAPRSAASRSAASDIVLTPDLVASLRRKVDEHNEAMRQRRAPEYRFASLPMLKAVLRRGMGAFSVSHRPNVSSRQQWGLARVNAFLRLLSTGRPLDPKYVSDNDLLPRGHERASGAGAAPQRSAKAERVDLGVSYFEQFGIHIKGRGLDFRRGLNAPYNPNARVRRVRRSASEPFDPLARDGDGDGIVQEGTIWERPAGTHWVTAEGERIERALPKLTARKRGDKVKEGEKVPARLYHPSMRLVDKNGNDVEYTPTWAGSRLGYRNRLLGSPIGGGIGRQRQPVNQSTAATARRNVSTPHRLARFDADTRSKILRLFSKGLPTIMRKNKETGEMEPFERPGSRYTPEQAVRRLSQILSIVRGDQTGKYADVWRQGKDWYEQQHYAMRRLAERRGVDFHLAVAVLAATSPRNPWDAWSTDRQKVIDLAKREGISLEDAAKRLRTDLYATPNIDIADFVLGNWPTMRDEKITLNDEMLATLEKSLTAAQMEKLRASLPAKGAAVRSLSNLSGSAGEPTDFDYKMAGILMAARALENQDHAESYLSAMVANALSIMDGGVDSIDERLRGPKARSFYDNIAFFNDSDAVTIDSIMAQLVTGLNAAQAGALLKPESGAKVRDRFGNEVAGYSTYAVISEIVHQVTDDWNAAHPTDLLSPTDVQAILWYVQRERPDIIDLLDEAQ